MIKQSIDVTPVAMKLYSVKLTVACRVLQGLTKVEDDTVFVDCSSLRSLSGLGSVTTLNKDLVLRNLPALTSTAGLGNVVSVGELL